MPPAAEALPPEFAVKTFKDRKDLDYFLLQMGDRSQETNVQWWVEYQRALLWQDEDAELACQKWMHLASEEKFPARDVAAARTVSVCETPHELVQNAPTWLSTFVEDQWLKHHRRKNNPLQIAELLLQRSKRPLPQEQKVMVVQESIQVAKLAKKTSSKEQKEPLKKFLADAQTRLEFLAPRFISKPKTKDFLRVAYDLRRARRFKEARKYYEKVFTSKAFSNLSKLSALYGIAMAHKNERHRDDHVKALARAEKFSFSQARKMKTRKNRNIWWQKYSDAAIDLARAEWTLGRREQGSKVLKRLTQRAKGKSSLATAYWVMGRMEDEAGNHLKASTWYAQGLLQKGRNPSDEERILWSLAWNLKQTKMLEESLQYFSTGSEKGTTEFSQFRFRFWKARTLKDLKKEDEAKALFAQLVEDDPLGYYGLMSQRELGQKLHLPVSAGEPLPASQLDQHFPRATFEWMVSLNERDVALSMLDETAVLLRRLEKKQTEDTSGTWTALFRAYGRAGQYLKLFEQMGRIPSDQRRTILSHHPELLFPQPYQDIISQAASEAEVAPELIFSIIRQESSFNPHARSPADAFGLMQLLPEVAAKNASKLGVPFERPEDLYSPEVNVPLGADFLRELGAKFNGQFIPMVASYNASQTAIKRWIGQHYKGDVLEFIEDIPYEETRGYVRLVLRNLIFYKLLRDPHKEMTFPEWTLKLSE